MSTHTILLDIKKREARLLRWDFGLVSSLSLRCRLAPGLSFCPGVWKHL